MLGDIINSEATYVKQPQLHLTDAGYADFSASEAISTRKGMVYVGANDGMLHAFFGETGEEAWAYVPTHVLPKLYKLADKGYANDHEYFVDGSPVIEDVYIGGQWRTLLVAGLGAGGRAYYAIDVTDPGNPKPLWEFTNNNLGYTIGKAEIAKLADGTWVVIVPSGYNNVSPGDGNGRLFVLDAATGMQVAAIPNGIETKVANLPVGSTTTPSGLGFIRAWADNSDLNNLALRVYGGDNLAMFGALTSTTTSLLRAMRPNGWRPWFRRVARPSPSHRGRNWVMWTAMPWSMWERGATSVSPTSATARRRASTPSRID